ncbi:hypothetical protein BKA70DRAFT_1289860 [Coprinopsis sp. MPI-PUGE-AT-0042]|nr:hypothetical protein BKA70DRAFT_1289860 [Coprinopsis sp. MPI-PUGE-AT-0042]
MPLWPTHEPYGPKDLAKRPKDWRADYQPRGGLAGVFGAFRGKSVVDEYTDSKNRTLHPLLQFNSLNPPIDHDLREHPFEPPSAIFSNLGRVPNQIDFAQLTTQPSCSMMRVYHPSLPWFIDVKQTHPNGVMIYDVFLQIWTQLAQPIRGRDFFNDELTDGDREVITRSWWERCEGDTTSQAYGRGVCQIDFLGRKCVLQGLARGKGGNWEMKCARADPD